MASYETKIIFSNNLSRLIDSTEDMTQDKLAKLMNVSPASVSGWCNGTKMPRMDKVEWIADYFKVSKSDLLEEKRNEDYTPTDADIQFALFGGKDDITEKMYEEVKSFAAFLKQRERYGE